ncbi:hypothetical protein QZH41_019614 [Actinostola sp. cb2023]|nr:hypothetical protein QZH41_019614 [Actinostola sp. cb2023]
MILTLGLIKVAVNIDECLQAHNSKRALHGAAPLTWDSRLAQQAQAYALKLANIKQMKHDPNNADGENPGIYLVIWRERIYMQGSHGGLIVWKSTKRLGVGIARNGNYIYVVARYSPPGNYDRQFAKNVGNKING